MIIYIIIIIVLAVIILIIVLLAHETKRNTSLVAPITDSNINETSLEQTESLSSISSKVSDNNIYDTAITLNKSEQTNCYNKLDRQQRTHVNQTYGELDI